MKWSDETVEAVAKRLHDHEVEFAEDSTTWEHRDNDDRKYFTENAQVALAAIAECGEVKALVEAAKESVSCLHDLANGKGGWAIENMADNLDEALRPFTEAV